MSEPLTGFVRVKDDIDYYRGKVGVISNTPNVINDYYLVRFGNDDEDLVFWPDELETLDTLDAQRILQEQAHG